MTVVISGTGGINTPGLESTAMPTVGGDAVVESGSNSDGMWTRWGDGTQTCSGRAENANPGTGGNTYNVMSGVTFPRAFSDRSYFVGLTQTGFPTAAENDWSHSAESRIETQFSIVTVTPVSYAVEALGILWFAEGRWK